MYIETFGPQAAAPVLCLHGGGAAGWSWRYAVQALGERYRCIVPDLPGSDPRLLALCAVHSAAESRAV